MRHSKLITLTKGEINTKETTLRIPCVSITKFDDKFQEFVDELISCFKSLGRGVGLAAPQLGNNICVAVVNSGRNNGEKPFVIVNPKILNYSGEETSFDEGCFSLPGIKGKVYRKNKISVRYQNRYGKTIRRQINGFESRVFQHEIDHLNGILFTDRMRKEVSIYEV